MVQPVRFSLSEFVRAIDKNSSRVRNSEEGSKGEQCCTDESPCILGWNEIEKCRRNSANEYGIIKPFLFADGLDSR
jgi:hypothetical protein